MAMSLEQSEVRQMSGYTQGSGLRLKTSGLKACLCSFRHARLKSMVIEQTYLAKRDCATVSRCARLVSVVLHILSVKLRSACTYDE